jgi:hypothetical protein
VCNLPSGVCRACPSQLEVLPLWQRTAELLPGLAPQLAALSANRAAYVALLQSAAAAAAAAAAPGGGAGMRGRRISVQSSRNARWPGAGAAPPGDAIDHTTPSRGESSGLAATGPREPRRFISVKARVPGPFGGGPGSAGGGLAGLDSGDEEASPERGSGPTMMGGGGRRPFSFVRAASSPSYDEEAPPGGGDASAAAGPAAGAAGPRWPPAVRGAAAPPRPLTPRSAAAAAAAASAAGGPGSAFAVAPGPGGLATGAYSRQPSDRSSSFLGPASGGLGPSTGPAGSGGPPPALASATSLVSELAPRRSSITTRLNALFVSFKADRRPNRPSVSGALPTVNLHVSLHAPLLCVLPHTLAVCAVARAARQPRQHAAEGSRAAAGRAWQRPRSDTAFRAPPPLPSVLRPERRARYRRVVTVSRVTHPAGCGLLQRQRRYGDLGRPAGAATFGSRCARTCPRATCPGVPLLRSVHAAATALKQRLKD